MQNMKAVEKNMAYNLNLWEPLQGQYKRDYKLLRQQHFKYNVAVLKQLNIETAEVYKKLKCKNYFTN